MQCSANALRQRALAFDGTVAGIDLASIRNFRTAIKSARGSHSRSTDGSVAAPPTRLPFGSTGGASLASTPASACSSPDSRVGAGPLSTIPLPGRTALPRPWNQGTADEWAATFEV